jgi:hypothetical protein
VVRDKDDLNKYGFLEMKNPFAGILGSCIVNVLYMVVGALNGSGTLPLVGNFASEIIQSWPCN